MSSSLLKRTHCPICSSSQLVTLHRQRFEDHHPSHYLQSAYGKDESFNLKLFENTCYALLQCTDCNLIFQESIPNDEMMYDLYERWIDPDIAFQRQNAQPLSHSSLYSQDIHQLLSQFSKKPSDIKVLDFGMGWGRWALMAKAFGCDVCGVELSPKRIECARKNGIEIIDWDAISLHQFDLINVDQVFEHIAAPVEVLGKLKQSLNADGLIKICVPNSFGIKYRIRKMNWTAPKGSLQSLNPVAPLEHINCYFRKSMLMLARQTGLSESKISIAQQYQYSTAWHQPKRVVRNAVMPIYRNLLGLQNYYLFQL